MTNSKQCTLVKKVFIAGFDTFHKKIGELTAVLYQFLTLWYGYQNLQFFLVYHNLPTVKPLIKPSP